MSMDEKLEKEANRLIDELDRLDAGDPNYRVVSENLERVTKILGESEKRDQERLNNNEKNDINRQSVEVDMEKVKADRLREWLGFLKTGIGICVGAGLTLFAYKEENEKFKLPIRCVLDGGKNLLRLFTR